MKRSDQRGKTLDPSYGPISNCKTELFFKLEKPLVGDTEKVYVPLHKLFWWPSIPYVSSLSAPANKTTYTEPAVLLLAFLKSSEAFFDFTLAKTDVVARRARRQVMGAYTKRILTPKLTHL